MAIIKKRAGDLQPGDVLADAGNGRRVVQYVADYGRDGVGLQSALIGTPHYPIAPALPLARHVEFDVEVPDLTPAQRHAEELLDVLRKAHAWGREVTGPVPAWIAEARELLDQVRPEPPTLAEALAALAGVANDPPQWREVTAAILDRARRAGLL